MINFIQLINMRFWVFVHNCIVHPLYGITPRAWWSVVHALHDATLPPVRELTPEEDFALATAESKALPKEEREEGERLEKVLEDQYRSLTHAEYHGNNR